MKGFAALVSVIIIGAVMVAAGMMVTLTSINEGQMSLSRLQGGDSHGLLDACVEDSLLFINENSTLPQTIVTTLGNCTTTLNSQIGTSWDFTLNGGLGAYQCTTRIKLDRSSNLNIGSWQDL